MLLAATLLLAGLILLTLAADRFVLAAARLSRVWGMSPILIGALVVGLGTSAPELLVSVLASARGEIDIAAGNVVGSNVSNLTLVLGTAALVRPIASHIRTIRREGFVMMLATLVLGGFLWDLQIGRFEAAGLAAGMVVVALLLVWWATGDAPRGRASPSDTGAGGSVDDAPDGLDAEGGDAVMDAAAFARTVSVRREVMLGSGSLLLTLLGADLLVRGATGLAEELGITTAFVGLVIVAVGTSLPELATALAAARRGETDLVLGNVLGSNLFNSLMVVGAGGLVGPGVIGPEFREAAVFMIGASVVAGLFAITGRRLVRWEGAVLLAGFMTFVAVAAA